MKRLLAVMLLWPIAASAGDVTIPNTFTNGTTADATQVNANFTALETAVDDNDSRIDTLQALDDVYYCENGVGADIGAKCNDIYSDMVAAGRGGVLQLPSGSFTQTTTIDLCDETGLDQWVPVRLRGGAAGTYLNRSTTRLLAGSGLASSAVADTFTITTAVDASNRDQIACASCDFRALGFRRNDLIETADFVAAANNNGRASADMPLRVYRATATALIVEGEIATDPGLSTVSEAATVRRLTSQIDTCHFGTYVENVEIDGDSSNQYADIGIRHRPDNDPNAECSASTVPYSYCTGADAGSPTRIPICVNCGVIGVTAQYHKYYGVAPLALEVSGQSDNYVIENSYIGNQDIGIYWDILQGKPGIVVRDTQIEAYRRSAARVASSSAHFESITAISDSADCASDTYGTCNMIEMLTNNTANLSVVRSQLEIEEGDGVVVGNLTSVARNVSLIGNMFYGNDANASAMAMVSIPGLCGVFENQANLYQNADTNAVAPTVTISNSNQATCPAYVFGRSSYDASGAEVDPVLTINNSIPYAILTTELEAKSASSSTDNAVPKFDSTAGDVQNSGVLIDDSNNVTVPGTLTTGGSEVPTCLILRDSDDAGNSACAVLNGTFSCETDTNGVCGDAT